MSTDLRRIHTSIPESSAAPPPRLGLTHRHLIPAGKSNNTHQMVNKITKTNQQNMAGTVPTNWCDRSSGERVSEMAWPMKVPWLIPPAMREYPAAQVHPGPGGILGSHPEHTRDSDIPGPGQDQEITGPQVRYARVPGAVESGGRLPPFPVGVAVGGERLNL